MLAGGIFYIKHVFLDENMTIVFLLCLEQLQVYERALRCIPEPEFSVDQDAAVFVTVHLLLTR